jgi:hypothetical protein
VRDRRAVDGDVVLADEVQLFADAGLGLVAGFLGLLGGDRDLAVLVDLLAAVALDLGLGEVVSASSAMLSSCFTARRFSLTQLSLMTSLAWWPRP